MGNCHVLFGKGPTEKDSNTSTSSVAYFTRWGGGLRRQPLLPNQSSTLHPPVRCLASL